VGANVHPSNTRTPREDFTAAKLLPKDEARRIAANVAKPAGAFAQRQFQMITMLGRSHEWAREASSLCPALSCVLHCGGWAVELANADD